MFSYRLNMMTFWFYLESLIIVILNTYVMRLCEFRFTVSFISIFSFYFLFSFHAYAILWHDTHILHYYSIIENVFKYNIISS